MHFVNHLRETFVFQTYGLVELIRPSTAICQRWGLESETRTQVATRVDLLATYLRLACYDLRLDLRLEAL